jgi:hypothetical protein
MSTALRSVGFLDVLSSTPAESSRCAPCIHVLLRRLVTKPGEKCGFMGSVPIYQNLMQIKERKFPAGYSSIAGLGRLLSGSGVEKCFQP